MKQINFKTSKIVQRIQTDRYKIFLSILFGFFGLLGAIFSIQYNVGEIRINVDWFLIFPILIALSWGRLYGCISIVLGLTIWYPFFIRGYHGWECFVPSICLFIWVMLHGYGAEKRLQSRNVFTNLYVLQLIYNIISLILYFNVLPFLLLFNPLFLNSGILTALSYGDIAFFAFKNIIFDSLILVIADILLQLPFIRRIFRLGYSQNSRYNTRIVFSVVIFGMLLFIIIITGYNYIIMKHNNLQWLLSRSSNVITGFYLTSIVSLIIGGLLARIFQWKLEITKLLNVSETMCNEANVNIKTLAANLEAIFEGTHDFIILIDENYQIITCNKAFKNFISEEREILITPGMSIADIVQEENVNILKIYFNKATEKGLFATQVNVRSLIFEITFFPIYEEGKSNRIAVFCKNITARKKAEDEILKLNNELEERVIERTAELKTAIDELETFTCTVSHDLKSPLRAINTYSRIMLEDYPQSMQGEMGEIINSIMNISRNMISMINKLLLYSTTAKKEINKEYINCNDMICKTFNEITSAFPDRQIKLIMEKELPQVKADSVLLKQVFYNVISNAVKFTKNRDPAIITVQHTMNKEEIIFSIQDNGVGFDMKLSGKLFGIFERLHSEEEFEGTGIGLATVRKIINKHAGRTWIEAVPDKGATVYIALPIAEG